MNHSNRSVIKAIFTGAQFWVPVLVLAAVLAIVWLAGGTARPPTAMSIPWMIALLAAMITLFLGCGVLLWKRTRFS